MVFGVFTQIAFGPGGRDLCGDLGHLFVFEAADLLAEFFVSLT